MKKRYIFAIGIVIIYLIMVFILIRASDNLDTVSKAPISPVVRIDNAASANNTQSAGASATITGKIK